MEQAIKRIAEERRPFQANGFVIGYEAKQAIVEVDGDVFTVRRAASCLIEPVPGDRVLVAGDLPDELFVIAVLERDTSTTLSITVEGSLTLGAPDGRVSIAAGRGLDLASVGEMTLTTSELAVRAPKGQLFFDQLVYTGLKVLAHVERIRLVGEFLDLIADRINQKIKRSFRTVEEVDQVRSNQIDYRAEKNMSLRGQNALVTAKELVKLDGDQIHVG